MHITELIIDNYRNYKKQHLRFSQSYNFIIGDNGQGKTNLIEAIYMLSMAKSFRINTDKDLIKKGEEYFYLKGMFYSDEYKETIQDIELGYNKQNKKAKINGVVQKRLSDWIGTLKTVVFLNQDIELILGSASNRRKYMDMVISLSNHQYLINLQKYIKALKNRNKLLKEEKEIFDIYDEQLIQYGSNIAYKRIQFFNEIKQIAKETFKQINPDITNFKLEYKANLGKTLSKNSEIKLEEIESIYKELLVKNKDRARLYKRTLTGIHLDDFNIKNNKEMFKKFASQGQVRAGALTLKMIAINHIEKTSGEKVILLLDDILLDLDSVKKNFFLTLVEDHQCFFTSTDTSGIGNINKPSVSDENKIFHIKNGEITLG